MNRTGWQHSKFPSLYDQSNQSKRSVEELFLSIGEFATWYFYRNKGDLISTVAL